MKNICCFFFFCLAQVTQTWIRERRASVWVLQSLGALAPSVYSSESSLMQATIMPCQRWCHKWPHFSASDWSAGCDTASLPALTYSEQPRVTVVSGLISLLSPPPPPHPPTFLFQSSVSALCSSFDWYCKRERERERGADGGGVSHLLIGSHQASQWCCAAVGHSSRVVRLGHACVYSYSLLFNQTCDHKLSCACRTMKLSSRSVNLSPACFTLNLWIWSQDRLMYPFLSFFCIFFFLIDPQ